MAVTKNDMKKKKLFSFFIFLLVSWFTFSFPSEAQTTDIYTFNTPQKQTEFDNLLKDLRCMVCQGQDLHDSQTPFAETLRQQIHTWVSEGKSEKEILDILTTRYGESISFNPTLQTNTYVLWIAPFFLFFIVILFLLLTIAKRKKSRVL